MQTNDKVLSDPDCKILGHHSNYNEVVLEGSSTEMQLSLNAFDNVFRKNCVFQLILADMNKRGLRPMNCSAHPSIHPCISYKHRGLCQKFTFWEYPIPEIPDDSEEKNRVWIGYCQNLSGRVSGARQSLLLEQGQSA